MGCACRLDCRFACGKGGTGGMEDRRAVAIGVAIGDPDTGELAGEALSDRCMACVPRACSHSL